jgi:hypothetical protein
LRNVGIRQIFYLQAIIQRTIVDFSRIFGARFGEKDLSLCPNMCAEKVEGLEAFLCEAAQNFEVFSNIQNKI